jgi:hypothetical protein
MLTRANVKRNILASLVPLTLAILIAAQALRNTFLDYLFQILVAIFFYVFFFRAIFPIMVTSAFSLMDENRQRFLRSNFVMRAFLILGEEVDG